MNVDSLGPWITTIASGLALIVGVLTALWAYAKFIVERGLLPPTQFSIDCTPLGTQHGMTLLELVVRLENRGNSALIATNTRLDLRYLQADDVPKLGYLAGTETIEEQRKKRLLMGRLQFPRSAPTSQRRCWSGRRDD